MKIAIDLTSLADNFSGIERYAMSIATELIELDVKKRNTYILLFKKKIHPELRRYAKKSNVICKVYSAGVRADLLANNKLLFQQLILPFHLYSVKADIYLFLAFQSPILFRRRGIYNTVHDLTCWDCPETMKKKMELYFKLSIRNALHVSKGIITISEFTRERIIDRFQYDKKKILIAYCGISDVFMRYVESLPQSLNKESTAEDKALSVRQSEKVRERSLDVRHKYHLPEQYLLCLATLEPRKNLPFLVEAYVELLAEESIDIPLVLAGRKGWKIDEFLEKMEQEYRKKIIITGFIEDEDLPYVYHMADCFIFPSVYEGFGMPPLEAMAVGTLVISSDAASLQEVLGKAASYFRLGNKEELKEKMRRGIRQENDGVTVREVKERVALFQWRESAKRVGEWISLMQ